MRRALVVFAMFALLAAAAARAEDLSTWSNLEQLRPGDQVQVVRTDLKSLTGKFAAVTGDAISIDVKGERKTVARTEVFRVSQLRQGRRARNAVIGAALGAGVGLAGGAGLLAATGGSDFTGAILAAAAGIGAGAGGGLGAAVPPYRTLYRARK